MINASNFVYDPALPAITTGDARLTRLLQRKPERCASISEYAAATGISTDQVIELFGPYLEDGTLDLEVWGDEIFLHTAPDGRASVPLERVQVAPNLWELLREHTSTEYAYALWKLIRDLEDGGWKTEVHTHRILSGLGPLRVRPYLGVYVNQLVVPALVLPTADELASPSGLLAEYERAGATIVAVICDEGALDERVTAVRRWVLGREYRPDLQVMILEAPRFMPTILTADDASVQAVDVTVNRINDLTWDGPGDGPVGPDGPGVRDGRSGWGAGPNAGGYGWT